MPNTITMSGDKLLSQLDPLVDPVLADIFYAISADGTRQGQVTGDQLKTLIQAGGNNIRSVAYTIGVPGVADVDYNFTSAANTTQQSIQLGAAAIVPINSYLSSYAAKCVAGPNLGVVTGPVSLGKTSGGTDYLNAYASLDDAEEFISNTMVVGTDASASSVYFSFTPSANWNTLTTGSWKVWIVIVDNSVL